jgi:hypothetical protein
MISRRRPTVELGKRAVRLQELHCSLALPAPSADLVSVGAQSGNHTQPPTRRTAVCPQYDGVSDDGDGQWMNSARVDTLGVHFAPIAVTHMFVDACSMTRPLRSPHPDRANRPIWY